MEAFEHKNWQLGTWGVRASREFAGWAGMRQGAFLQESAVARLRQVYEMVAAANGEPRKTEALLKAAELPDNAEVADYYLSLYTLHLTKRDHLRLSPRVGQGLSKLLALKAMLDVNVPELREGMSFDETLIDENVVADIFLFSKAIRDLVPYTIRIESVGLGCVWLEFGVYGDKAAYQRERDLPFLPKKVLEASPDETPTGVWRDTKKRFRVAAIELSPV